MGQRLLELFSQAEALGGYPAKVRLAGLTGITSTQAGAVPDDDARVAAARAALEQVTRELRAVPVAPGAGKVSASAAAASGVEAHLRRYLQIVADMMGQRAVFFSRPAETLARVTEAAAAGLDVARASVWFYDERRTLIRCADLFERDAGTHSAGVELQARSFPAYFRAVESERTIAAHDARTDPRTCEFARPYLEPLGIVSMLDVPIWVAGRMVGVVCHEQVGRRRTWTADEENFAYTQAGLVALSEELAQLRRR